MYKDDMIEIDNLSNLTVLEAKDLIGAKIINIYASEYKLELTLDNGKVLKVAGSTYGDCALSVDIEKGE